MSTSKGNNPFTRREFLQFLSTIGGAAALSAFLQACSQAGIDPTQLSTPTKPKPSPPPTDQPEPTATYQQELTETEEPDPSPTESPTETIVGDTSLVAFIKTDDRVKGVRQVMEMFDLSHIKGK
ncbi:MAG: twin-arginine translocation signal domain-containing protein, partial [Anaerolineales bacterium]